MVNQQWYHFVYNDNNNLNGSDSNDDGKSAGGVSKFTLNSKSAVSRLSRKSQNQFLFTSQYNKSIKHAKETPKFDDCLPENKKSDSPAGMKFEK